MSDKPYTGHKNPKMLNGQTLAQYITETVKDECRFFGVDLPSQQQMAVVISALRMHSIMRQAADYDRSEPGDPEKITENWPIESSIGRFFRDAARVTLDEYKKRLLKGTSHE